MHYSMTYVITQYFINIRREHNYHVVVGNKGSTSLLFYSGIFENVTSLRDSGFSPPDSALRGE